MIGFGLFSAACGVGLLRSPRSFVGNPVNPIWPEWQVRALGTWFVVFGAAVAVLAAIALFGDRGQS